MLFPYCNLCTGYIVTGYIVTSYTVYIVAVFPAGHAVPLLLLLHMHKAVNMCCHFVFAQVVSWNSQGFSTFVCFDYSGSLTH